MSRRLRSALLLGLTTALIGCLFFISPWGARIEETAGLRWLFLIRGEQRAPEGVTIVAITKDASEALGVPYKAHAWPRTLHAKLVDRLTQAGARTIVFDLLFKEERKSEDEAFAAALAHAGNVALLEFLEKDAVGNAQTQPLLTMSSVHRLLQPTETLTGAAAALGPFTLPKVPMQVAQFWTFDANAGGVASLPLLALALHLDGDQRLLSRLVPSSGLEGHPAPDSRSLRPRLPRLLEAVSAHLRLADDAIGRERVAGNSDDGLDKADMRQQAMATLVAALSGPTTRYLNFYGPPWTIRTVHYHQALKALGDAPTDWSDQAVFIGLSSPVQWQQADEFITPFSDTESGHDLSGIEILATAFANLLTGSSIRPLPASLGLGLILLWGIGIGVLARMISPTWAMLGTLVLCGGYFSVALALFSDRYLWLPTVTPLIVQATVAIFAAVVLHYYTANRDRRRIRELFGYYLPDRVVDRLVREGSHPRDDRETVFGVCLYSDAAAYTTLSEGMSPDELAAYMDDYYEVVFEPVRRHGGSISDVVGDAMMAIWAAREDDREIRKAACLAALEIQQALRHRANDSGDALLETRIGIHCGAMTLAHVGAQDHYEYRAVGDIVNTASRLEALNAELGTSILVSAAVLADSDEAEFRALGHYPIRGKKRTLDVAELLDWRTQTQA